MMREIEVSYQEKKMKNQNDERNRAIIAQEKIGETVLYKLYTQQITKLMC